MIERTLSKFNENTKFRNEKFGAKIGLSLANLKFFLDFGIYIHSMWMENNNNQSNLKFIRKIARCFSVFVII